jgi:malate/lactate dehydrogenase
LAALQHRIQKREARILRQLGAGNGAIAEAAAIAELVEQRRAGLQRLRWL